MLDMVVIALYLLDTILLIQYLSKLRRCYSFIFSLFNISLFTWTFSLIIAPVFLLVDKSWFGLGVRSASSMIEWTEKSLIINLTGYAITLFVVVWHTNRANKTQDKVRTRIDSSTARIKETPIHVLCTICIILFCMICFIYNGTFPLLNAGRYFYYQTQISAIYQAVYKMIGIFGLFYGVKFISKRKHFLPFVVCFTCLFLSGSRSEALVHVLFPTFVLYVYKRNLTGNKKRSTMSKGTSLRMIIGAVLIALLGVAYLGVRMGGSLLSIPQIIEEILYGGTFSDIRDGAYLLSRWDSVMNNQYLLGKTYEAGIISFIPSSMSSFRDVWSWGRFTSRMLVGMSSIHLGLRGGWYMEAFMNFGVVGLAINGVLLAILLANLDKQFGTLFINRISEVNGVEIFPCLLYQSLFAAFTCTSSSFQVYTIIGTIMILRAMSKVTISKRAIHSIQH